MAQQAQWETFSDGGGDDDDGDDDETLSLCDLPVRSLEKQETDDKSSVTLGDFEFRALGNGLSLKPGGAENEMCAADDIFYRGQLLPLGSCGGSLSGRSFSSNSISSSNCSSSSVSRSQSSSSSQNSSNLDGPRLSISNKFYAHPSPRPQVRTSFVGSGRKSTGSAPPRWAMFRLGVAKAPEIELSDLKLRRLRSSEGKCVAKSTKSSRFGCTCTPDVSEPVPMTAAPPLIPKRKKKEKEMVVGYERRESICKSSRMFEWLEELSIGKGSAMG